MVDNTDSAGRGRNKNETRDPYFFIDMEEELLLTTTKGTSLSRSSTTLGDGTYIRMEDMFLDGIQGTFENCTKRETRKANF